jgi:rhodanese-related sulfurtransferase
MGADQAGLSAITAEQLAARLWRKGAPLVVDVRRPAAFAASGRILAGALRRRPELIDGWAGTVPASVELVVYCVHGHEVSRDAAAELRARGWPAQYLAGGFEGWLEAGLPTCRWRAPLGEVPSIWVTRERPKIDRIACPWLIRRCIDPSALIRFVPPAEVLPAAAAHGWTPFDVPDVELSHRGERCSFDTFIELFELDLPGLAELAPIVRGADTDRHDLAPQAAGLLAVSLGLSLLFEDDQAQLERGLVVYDALRLWAARGRGETHDWQPERMRAAMARS